MNRLKDRGHVPVATQPGLSGKQIICEQLGRISSRVLPGFGSMAHIFVFEVDLADKVVECSLGAAIGRDWKLQFRLIRDGSALRGYDDEFWYFAL